MTTSDPFYATADGRTRLFGQRWEQAQRGLLAVLCCRLGRHRRVMWGWINGSSQERCSCGAVRRLDQQWSGGDAGRRRSVRSLAEDITIDLTRVGTRRTMVDWLS